MKPSILIVEDETDVRELITLHLAREGYAADESADGEDGLKKAFAKNYQLYILDWMLPKASGLELTRELRKRSSTPILMVTARAEATDVVVGLEAGADDYIIKPFEIPVLIARVRALLRRGQGAPAPTPQTDRLSIGHVQINIPAHEATCSGQLLNLTPSEFNLLVSLARNPGRVFTRDQLIDLVRGEDVTIVSRAIDTHVFGLRKKLGPCADVIETIRGVGYRVKAAD